VTRRSERGITYLEVVATAVILAILAMAILPTAKATTQRAREIELRMSLQKIRDCIDQYHARCDAQIPVADGIKIGKNTGVGCSEPTWPEKLEDLVESPVIGALPDKKWHCLRRIPVDPMSEEGKFVLKCQDDSENTDNCRQGIWDVHSKSTQKPLSGKGAYKDW
jgi:type II secretory pathway pseudopilin PulG